MYDENRNLLYKDTGISELDRVCYVSDSRAKIMRILAYIVLFSFIFVFAVLFLMTLCCWKKHWDLGACWKFLIHHWMKLQLVAFFALLAIYMPCCVRTFLHQLYKWAVSWDHALRHPLNDTYEDNSDYS